VGQLAPFGRRQAEHRRLGGCEEGRGDEHDGQHDERGRVPLEEVGGERERAGHRAPSVGKWSKAGAGQARPSSSTRAPSVIRPMRATATPYRRANASTGASGAVVNNSW